jgi:hypothetical protein
MLARIYQPSKSAMQSGQANTRQWVLEFEPAERRQIEPLMGWTSSGDTRRQVRLTFDTRDQAVAYATSHGIPHQVLASRERRRKAKSYSDNFAFDRKEPWTH